MKKSWQITSLGDVAEVIAGQSPVSKFYNKDGNGLPFYQGKKQFTKKYIAQPDTWTTKVTKKAVRADILMSVRAPVGPINFSTQEICIGRGLAAIRANSDLNKEYLFYYLLKHETGIVENSGAVFNSINKKQIEQISIPVPPLAEQEAIVEVLDKAFAAIDQAKANIQQNIANAKELFQSKLNQIFSQKGEGWVEKTLGEVSEVLNGYAFKSKDTVSCSQTQLLRMGNLYKNVLDLGRKPVFYPDEYANKHTRFLLKEGDLIMSLTGTVDKTDYGYTVKVPKTDLNILLNQRIMKISILDNTELSKDYLEIYLLSPPFLEMLYSSASGTRQANLSSKTILTFPVYFPKSITEQLSIVNTLHSIKATRDGLLARYTNKLASLDELKKSILQKAFAGELT